MRNGIRFWFWAVSVGVLAGGFNARAQSAPNLYETAEVFIDIAEASKREHKLWGRLGGSEAERESARSLVELLTPFSDEATVEPVRVRAYRPRLWQLHVDGGDEFLSAVPVPADSRAEITDGSFDVVQVDNDSDWERVSGIC